MAHTAPVFDLPDWVEVVATGAYQGEGRHNVRDSRIRMGAGAHNVDYYYPLLTGSAAIFYISELLQQRDVSGKYMALFQYRKMITVAPVGKASTTYGGGMRILEGAQNREQTLALLEALPRRPVVAQPMYFPQGIMHQYANSHHLADFLTLLRHTMDAGIFDGPQAWAFMHSCLLIPGGMEFGVVPCEVYIDVIEKLRLVAHRFLAYSQPADERNEYQRRAFSFFSERLSGYLFMQAMGWGITSIDHANGTAFHNVPDHGYMCTVTEPGGDYGVFGLQPA